MQACLANSKLVLKLVCAGKNPAMAAKRISYLLSDSKNVFLQLFFLLRNLDSQYNRST
jgi:hypothetical protein